MSEKYSFPVFLFFFLSAGSYASAFAEGDSGLLLSCMKPPSARPLSKIVQTLESFSNEYKWINVKKCKRPTSKAPLQIWINDPKKSKVKGKKAVFADGRIGMVTVYVKSMTLKICGKKMPLMRMK